MKIKELISSGRDKLCSNGVEDYSIISKALAKFLLNMSDSQIAINESNEVTSKIEEKYFLAISEIIKGKPLQYITNKQEFMGMEFYVDENVLIPQPDTETLVCEVIDICKNINKKIKILDICTGSGAIAVSIAKNCLNSEIIASDISEKALEIAKKNAENNNAEIEFIQSNMFENINESFDIIVSNPPYIKTEVIKNLDIQVQNEPHIALDGGKDGLNFYRILAENSRNFLNANGLLCLEIGFDQKEEVEQLLKENSFTNIYSKRDLAGNDRIIVANL